MTGQWSNKETSLGIAEGRNKKYHELVEGGDIIKDNQDVRKKDMDLS